MKTLVWNSRTKQFAVLSRELAHAMMSFGSVEGFNHATESPRLDSITLSQRGKTARVTIKAGKDELHADSGRIEAKRLVCLLAEWTKAPAFNVKDSGKTVPFAI